MTDDYESALGFIHSTLKFGSKPGLERIAELCRRLGNPQDKLKFVHVAGTNGKGSTVTMIASALELSGLRVGKYTSPYIYDFRERIEVNGQKISEDAVIRLTQKVRDVCLSMDEHPTEFELVTALAFLYYVEQKCDIVVLEVGLGGRFDATNIIKDPLVSVICSISMDHMAVLGDTVTKIAYEKCGIIKPGRPAVLYPKNPESVIEVVRQQCKEKGSKLYIPDLSLLKDKSIGPKNEFSYKGLNFNLSLRGRHQIYNALTAVTALEVLDKTTDFVVSDNNIVTGINNAMLPARFELFCKNPKIYIDAGHNKEGIDSLVGALNNEADTGPLTFIFGMLRDKPYQYAIQKLASMADMFICVTPDSPRALSAFDMCNISKLYCEKCYGFDAALPAVKAALKNQADTYGSIVICGSFYVIDKVVKELKEHL